MKATPILFAALRKLYPKDEATGLRPGKLRGIWRVKFKPAGASADELKR